MRDRGLRQRCDALLRDLEIPRPFDVAALCRNVGRRRGRPIHLLPMALPAAGPCGLWVAGDRQDYIVHQRHTTRIHQEHIIAHELGHLLCQHPGGPRLTAEHARLLFPTLDPEAVRRVLGRGGYTSAEEREAEIVASVILQRAERASPPGPRVPDPQTARILQRLESSLRPRN